VRRDPTAGSGTSWARNGTARYVVSRHEPWTGRCQ
jgi:hypothetical protein